MTEFYNTDDSSENITETIDEIKNYVHNHPDSKRLFYVNLEYSHLKHFNYELNQELYDRCLKNLSFILFDAKTNEQVCTCYIEATDKYDGKYGQKGLHLMKLITDKNIRDYENIQYLFEIMVITNESKPIANDDIHYMWWRYEDDESGDLHNVLRNLQNSFIVNKGEDCVFGSTEFLKYK